MNDKTTESIISTPIARDDELVISTEIIRDQSSLSQAKEQVLTPPKSEFYADDKISDEEKITPATVSSQVNTNLSSTKFSSSIYERFLATKYFSQLHISNSSIQFHLKMM